MAAEPAADPRDLPDQPLHVDPHPVVDRLQSLVGYRHPGPVGTSHALEGRPEDRSVQFAFEELKFFTDYFRVLGVYEADTAEDEKGR